MKISDLARVMVEEYAPQHGYQPGDIRIKIIGKRGGEKLFEELMTKEEAEYAYENNDMFIILPQRITHEIPFEPKKPRTFKKSVIEEFSSRNAELLSTEEIRTLIRKIG